MLKEYLFIVIRHKHGNDPAVIDVRKVESEENAVEKYSEEILDEVREKFCKEFKEFYNVEWYIDYRAEWYIDYRPFPF